MQTKLHAYANKIRYACRQNYIRMQIKLDTHADNQNTECYALCKCLMPAAHALSLRSAHCCKQPC
jgi:hypothetical protein